MKPAAGRPSYRRMTRLGLAVLALVAGVAAVRFFPRGGFGWEPNTRMPPPRPAPLPAAVGGGPDDFYAARLGSWEAAQARRAHARTSLQESELRWVSTAQDSRAALMVSEETGFATWGVETQVAEIPAGWHTGKHRHGEEAIYIVTGEGFVAVDGVRYDFQAGTTLGIAHGSEHQLYATGGSAVRYVSATAHPLEKHLGLSRLEQLEARGLIRSVPPLPTSSDGFDPRGRRIRLRWEEADYRDGAVGVRASAEAWLRAGVSLDRRSRDGTPLERGHAAAIASRLAHHGAWIRTMGAPGEQGFPNRLVVMSGFLIDQPGSRSGRHSHMDAILYVVAGHGYSIVDGRKLPWGPGTSLHVQGPQTSHQHFNTGSEPAVLLRIVSGLRSSFQEVFADAFPLLWFEAQGPIGDEPER
jgi:uncharacterized cupin superfamily protein